LLQRPTIQKASSGGGAMPCSWLAALARLTKQPRHALLDYMDREWWTTSSLLYDPVRHLYSRDATFLDHHEKNGAKLFWSRGNGWVLGGLARVLAYMPANYPSRGRYIDQYRKWPRRSRPSRGQTACGAVDCLILPPIRILKFRAQPSSRLPWRGA